MDQNRYEEKIASQMTCVDFLKFKYNNKTILLEDIIQSENEFLDFISKCIIIYKGKEYTFKEYNEDLIFTNEKFQADLVDNYYIKNSDEVFTMYKKYYRVLKFFESISNNITYAKYYADRSYQKLPENFYELKRGNAFVFFIRGMSFLSSVMWYGTCRDYLLQIFCAKFDLYAEFTNEDVEKMRFKDLVKLCNFKQIREKKENHENDKEYCLWFEKLDECANYLDKDLTPLNNMLKHRGGCNLKNFNGNFFNYDNNDNSLDYFNIPNVDIDEEYDLLIKSHNSIVDCYNYFLNSINKELDLLFKRNTNK